MNNTFASYHPVINFGFFCAVIGTGVFLQHPVMIGIAVVSSLAYALMLGGKSTLKFALLFVVPMVLVFGAVNILVNPKGNTVLFYIFGNEATLESLMYGLVTGMMLAAVLLWFSCFNKIITSDKITFLFGRIIPALSLVFTMVLRFVPDFTAQLRRISESQKCIGKDASSGTAKEKAAHGIRIVGIMFTWALENAILTADSMRSRGYGMENRSHFSLYRFDRRDGVAAVFIAVMTIAAAAGIISGRCDMVFYPFMALPEVDAGAVVMYAAYLMLCLFPVAVEVKEVAVWKLLQSKI